jgi:hypothetical protein
MRLFYCLRQAYDCCATPTNKQKYNVPMMIDTKLPLIQPLLSRFQQLAIE